MTVMNINEVPSVIAMRTEREQRKAALLTLAASFAASLTSDERACMSGGIFPVSIVKFRDDNKIDPKEMEFTAELMRLGEIELKSTPRKLTSDEIVAKLVKLFREAAKAAEAADPGEGLQNDGGTCNQDTPAFRIEGVRFTVIERAALLSAIEVDQFTWLEKKKWCWLWVPLRGQADRRSKMMEAAQRVLNAFAESNEIPGFRACGYQAAN